MFFNNNNIYLFRTDSSVIEKFFQHFSPGSIQVYYINLSFLIASYWINYSKMRHFIPVTVIGWNENDNVIALVYLTKAFDYWIEQFYNTNYEKVIGFIAVTNLFPTMLPSSLSNISCLCSFIEKNPFNIFRVSYFSNLLNCTFFELIFELF